MRKNRERNTSNCEIRTKSNEQTQKIQKLITLGKIQMEQTLTDFVSDLWWPNWALLKYQPATLSSYKVEIEQRILPVFGPFHLTEIHPVMLSQFYAALGRPGMRQDGGKLSYSSIKKTETVLSSILSTAVEWGLIESNPCRKVSPLHNEQDEDAPAPKFLTIDQTRQLLDFISQPYMYLVKGHVRCDDTGIPYEVPDYYIQKTVPLQMQVMIHLAIFTGARKGELLALQWNDIDFTCGSIRITKSLTRSDGKNIIKKPKTKASMRMIFVPQITLERLNMLKEWQDEKRKEKGTDWNKNKWLFTSDDGSVMGYHTPYGTLRKIIKRYNADKPDAEKFPMISFHALRHTCATLLVGYHQDVRTVAARLGHANPSVTLKVYTHAMEENDRIAGNTLATLLN